MPHMRRGRTGGRGHACSSHMCCLTSLIEEGRRRQRHCWAGRRRRKNSASGRRRRAKEGRDRRAGQNRHTSWKRRADTWASAAPAHLFLLSICLFCRVPLSFTLFVHTAHSALPALSCFAFHHMALLTHTTSSCMAPHASFPLFLFLLSCLGRPLWSGRRQKNFPSATTPSLFLTSDRKAAYVGNGQGHTSLSTSLSPGVKRRIIFLSHITHTHGRRRHYLAHSHLFPLISAAS